jgi:putative aldouronate transport system permease protein
MANRKRLSKDFIFQAVICLISVLIVFTMIYPFYYCLVQSFNDGYDSRVGSVYWLPRKFTLENYKTVFVNPNILQTFATTVIKTVAGTVTSLLFTAMFAYGLSKKILYRRLYSLLGLVTMYFSGGLIPYYFLIRSLKMIDTFWVYVIPSLFSFYNALLLMANFRAIPESIEESALIDGARPIITFYRIILPLSTPIIATIALFNGVGHWNDWFTTAIYTRSPWLNTLPVLLKDIINYASNQTEIEQKLITNRSNVTVEAVRYATMMVAVLPITISYPFLQKYFVKGMMIGAVKA